MAELRVRTIDEAELDTVLANDIEFEGTIEFSEPLLVKGSVQGKIKTESDLFVADSAQVQADIVAARVSVKGTVRGDIDARERIELFSGATIVGNISSPDLIIQSGSHFTGHCAMPGGDEHRSNKRGDSKAGVDADDGNERGSDKKGKDQRHDSRVPETDGEATNET